MTGDCQVRICGSLGVRVPQARDGLPTELPVSYRQNCIGDRFLLCLRGLTSALAAVRGWFYRTRAAGLQRSGGLGRGCCRAGGDGRGGGGCCGLSAVWEVVAQAGAASPCPAGDAGLVAGGEGPPGADLADVGGHQQQRGEQGAGGDAADPAAGGGGEGFVGGVFDEPVEAFDGVAQGGVAGVPGRAAVGQVLAVAGAGVGGDGDRGLAAEPGWFRGRLEDLGPPVAR